ncbi:phosphatidylinositol-specific phospholipase C [Kitasatospora sp. NPDC004531]
MNRHVRGTVGAILSAVLGLGSLMVSAAAPAHADSPMSTPWYESLSSATAGSDWMQGVPDSTDLGAMSIPGTHESLSTFGGDSTQTQEGDSTQAGNLPAQLAAGIRAFDIRVRVVGGQSKSNGEYVAGSYAVHHGMVYQHAMLGDALNQFQTFLANHPGETLLLRLKAECTGSGTSCTDDLVDVEAPPVYDSASETYVPATPSADAKTAYRKNLFGRYFAERPGLFYAPSVTPPTDTVNQGEVPTLGAVRGKLVLTGLYGPFGGDYGWGLKQQTSGMENNKGASLAGEAGDCKDRTDSADHTCFVQDQYDVPNMMAIASKRDYVRRHLDRQNSDPDQDKKLYINYTSGASEFAYPYSVASGCAAQICTSQGVNEFLLTYLNQTTGTHAPVVRTGVVMMDFPGGALIDKIVSYNSYRPGTGGTVAPTASTAAADKFLLDAIDRYGSQDALRIPQSYTGGHFGPGDPWGPAGYQSSFTYDNALTVMALLTNRTGTDLGHAVALGDSLLYAQDHDPVNDGRIRASYLPDPFVTTLGRDYPVGTPYIGGWSVYTGNMAWAGMAFCHLYRATNDSKYLNGALRAANWIQANSADTRGAGGYTGGYADTSPAEDGSGMVQRTWKATEHNIDVGAFFTMLSQLTGDQAWKSRGDNAFAFVKSMLSADSNHLWTGTGLDGVTVNEDAVPEDVQTWSYLATLDSAYARTTDWAAGRMAATDGPFSGVGFSTADTSKVWFEGTAHLLAAYNRRKAPGDDAKAAALLSTLQLAQTGAPNANGTGIVAASSDGLVTGQGDIYYASQHTGATAWYLIAARGGNPFRL